MAFKLADRAVQTSTITGNGGPVVLIAPAAGAQSFVAGVGDGNSTAYLIEDPNTGDWELTIGTVTAGTSGGSDSLSRAAFPIQSSTGVKVVFAAGVKTIACVPITELLVYLAAVPAYADDQILQRKGGAWVLRTPAQLSADLIAAGHGRNQLSGLTLSAVGGSTSFGIAAGSAADSTNADVMVLAAAMTKTTGVWAVGSGNGGLDTGAIAATAWYHAHLIKRPDTGVVDVLVSLSASAPTLPANYTLFRRIGSVRADGSKNWVKFKQLGDKFLWTSPVANANPTTIGTAASTISATVPTGVQVEALLNAGIVNAASSDVRLSSLDVDDTAATAVYCQLICGTTAAAFGQFSIRTDTSGQFRARADTANTGFYCSTEGWTDARGKA